MHENTSKRKHKASFAHEFDFDKIAQRFQLANIANITTRAISLLNRIEARMINHGRKQAEDTATNRETTKVVPRKVTARAKHKRQDNNDDDRMAGRTSG